MANIILHQLVGVGTLLGVVTLPVWTILFGVNLIRKKAFDNYSNNMIMKKVLTAIVFFLICGNLFAQNIKEDKTAIKQIIQQQENAWNRHNWEDLSS